MVAVVSMIIPAHSVIEVHRLLVSNAVQETPIAGDVPAQLVSHGLQCAMLLAASHPDDLSLQLAGLLHDVGLLLVLGDELGHPQHASDYVRPLFGDRCADLIALHVTAQRYLERTIAGYRVVPPPTAAFAAQPDEMIDPEREAFEKHALFLPALELRRADDAANEEIRPFDRLPLWLTRMGDGAR